MKGLLLTDFYMAIKYCRSYFLIMLVFIAVSFWGDDNAFFILYPMVLAGMLPVTLLGYSERCKWNVYCEALPITRKQMVAEKYLLTGGLLCGIFLIIAAVQGVRLSATGSFDAVEYCAFLFPLLTAGFLSPSVTLPCIFKYGIEKGRIAYYVVVGFVCALGAAIVAIPKSTEPLSVLQMHTGVLGAMPCIGLLLFAVSYAISVKVYAKREID